MAFSKDNLLLFFILTSAVGVSVSYGKIYLFHIALVLVIVTYLLSKKGTARFAQGQKYHHIFYLMIAWYSLSILWSIKPIYSVTYMFYILCGVCLLLSVVSFCRTIDRQDKLIRGLSIIFGIEIIVSLLEAFTSFRMPISPYSEYVQYFGRDADIEYINTITNKLSLNLDTPTGFEWNPNNLSIVMVIIFPFYFFAKNNIKYLGVVLIPLIIYMGESRGVAIAFIVVLFMCLTYVAPKRLVIYAFSTIIITFFVAYLIGANPNAFEDRKYQQMVGVVESLERYVSSDATYDDSIGIRKALINNGMNALLDSYGLGVGGGGSIAVQEDQGGVAGKYKSMHNFWVEMLVDSGIVFTLAFMVWYIVLTHRLYQITKRSKGNIVYYSRSLFISMVGFSISAISASSVIYCLPMWLMYGLSIATIANYSKGKSRRRRAPIPL